MNQRSPDSGKCKRADTVATLQGEVAVDAPTLIAEAMALSATADSAALPPRVFLETVEQSPVAISITDANANILYANSACERVTGYPPSELVGNNQSILSNKATPKSVYQELWGCIGAKRSWNGVLVNRKKDGTPYLADLTVAPILNEAGEICYCVGIHKDVTAVHHLERQVHNQKALIESVVDAIPAAVALLDKDGKVLLDNHAYKKLFTDLRGGEPALQLLAAVPGFSQAELVRACADERSFTNHEVRFDRGGRGDPRWFTCSGTWVSEMEVSVDGYFESNSAAYLLFVATEITALKREQEKARMSAVRALMAEQQMVQGIRETLSGALYQLQVPVNVASAVKTMLERREGDHEPVLAVLDQMCEAGKRAMETLTSALPPLPVEPLGLVNLNEVVRDVLSISTERLLAAGVQVDWLPEAILPALNGYRQRLRTLVKQLLDNAIDAMSEPGVRGSELEIVTRAKGDSLQLLIQDSGPGLDEALHVRVFEPFFSSWHTHSGRTGMGLALAQEVAVQHGGDIRFEQVAGKGARVCVTLPRIGGTS